MQKTFQVRNVKCGGCATTLRTKLKEEFGEIDVNLDKMPREITLEIAPDRIDALSKALKSLGYPLATEEMGLLESSSAKAKSFVSCAMGRIEGDASEQKRQ
jgi:copper chaperone